MYVWDVDVGVEGGVDWVKIDRMPPSPAFYTSNFWDRLQQFKQPKTSIQLSIQMSILKSGGFSFESSFHH